jgi:hypothetical protein
MTYERHHLSAAWGDMPEDELQALQDDIEINGQRDPITLYEGAVLDGWHRYQACTRLGLEPKTETLPADEDPRAWVISRNARRRSQTASQRAMAIVECQQWNPVGRPKNSAPGAELPANTTKQMAEAVGVGTRTIERAKQVAAEAAPEVKEAVKSGKVSVKAAAAVTSLPQEEQAAALADPKRAKKKKKPAKPEAAPVEPSDPELGQDPADLLNEFKRDLERAEGRVRDLEALLAADDTRKALLDMNRRLEHAERRRDEVMADAARIKGRCELYERLLSRCGRAVGERDLDKVAPAVEAMARSVRKVAA